MEVASSATADILIARPKDRPISEHMDEASERDQTRARSEAMLDPRDRGLRDPGPLRQRVLAQAAVEPGEPQLVAEVLQGDPDRSIAIRWSVGHGAVKPMTLIRDLSAPERLEPLPPLGPSLMR